MSRPEGKKFTGRKSPRTKILSLIPTGTGIFTPAALLKIGT
jgi:hypothetical protein